MKSLKLKSTLIALSLTALKREAKTEADLAVAKADGKVTGAERKGLHQELNKDSRAIHRQKHDRQHDLNHNGRMDRGHRRLP